MNDNAYYLIIYKNAYLVLPLGKLLNDINSYSFCKEPIIQFKDNVIEMNYFSLITKAIYPLITTLPILLSCADSQVST